MSERQGPGHGLSEHELSEIRMLIEERTGICFDESRERFFSTRVREHLRAKGLQCGTDLLRSMSKSNVEYEALLERLLTQETSFFRYPGVYEAFEKRVLPELHARFTAAGGTIQFASEANPEDLDGIVIDCRGLAAREAQPALRGVKGEIILIETDEVELSRPVRLIHPRWPLYVIPRGGNRFMLGATSIESEDNSVSVRSALELLGAAYAVHPAFAEARIVEFGSGLRPAFPDNLPRIAIDNQKIAVNGLYRHGFLLAPALAELTLGYVQRGVIDNEVMQCA